MTLDKNIYLCLSCRWEAEKAVRLQNREERSDDSRFVGKFHILTTLVSLTAIFMFLPLVGEKAAELHGLDDLPDPEEVAAARAELKVLHDERSRTEKLKGNLEKELFETRAKAKDMEELLPRKVTSEEQKEILLLLCKVHELEIENTEMQSESFLKEHEIRKRDLVISKFRNHRQLCAEIITQQKQLLDHNQVEINKELEEMFDIYQQEGIDPIFMGNFSLSDIDTKVESCEMSCNYLIRGVCLSEFSKLWQIVAVCSRRMLFQPWRIPLCEFYEFLCILIFCFDCCVR